MDLSNQNLDNVRQYIGNLQNPELDFMVLHFTDPTTGQVFASTGTATISYNDYSASVAATMRSNGSEIETTVAGLYLAVAQLRIIDVARPILHGIIFNYNDGSNSSALPSWIPTNHITPANLSRSIPQATALLFLPEGATVSHRKDHTTGATRIGGGSNEIAKLDTSLSLLRLG